MTSSSGPVPLLGVPLRFHFRTASWISTCTGTERGRKHGHQEVAPQYTCGMRQSIPPPWCRGRSFLLVPRACMQDRGRTETDRSGATPHLDHTHAQRPLIRTQHSKPHKPFSSCASPHLDHVHAERAGDHDGEEQQRGVALKGAVQRLGDVREQPPQQDDLQSCGRAAEGKRWYSKRHLTSQPSAERHSPRCRSRTRGQAGPTPHGSCS